MVDLGWGAKKEESSGLPTGWMMSQLLLWRSWGSSDLLGKSRKLFGHVNLKVEMRKLEDGH